MDIVNFLVWWLHFVLGLIGWFTHLHIFPEQLGVTRSQDNFVQTAEEGASFCETPHASIASLTPSKSFAGSILVPSDGHAYGKAREQYASVTYAQALSPNIITLVESEDDAQAAVKFAAQCGYSVSIRSGGHSYLGTSSCDSASGQCLQIDVTGLNQLEIVPDTNLVKVGPGNRLKDASEFLHQHGRFVPTGECPTVALGGHMQSGGFGLFTRHFGPFVNRVASFRIVLADGSLHEIVTPVENETSQLNDDLFYAVLGGASGSWGVVTEMTLNTLRDDDYFSVYWKIGYWWDTEEDTDGIANMMKTWTRLATEKKNDTRWAYHWSVVGAKNIPTLGNRIQMEGSWVAPKSQAHEYDYDFFKTIDDACTNCNKFRYVNVTEPLSRIWRHRYLRTMINKGTGREFPVPYTRAMQQTQDFPTPEGMEGITREIAKLLPHRLSSHFMISQLTTLKAAEPNRALPWPEDSLGITLDYFFVPGSDFLIDHHGRALNFGKQVRHHIQDQDHRMYWAAYDEPKLYKDWPKYFETEVKYRRLQTIKQSVDPTNLFQNEMSIPLPNDPAEKTAAQGSKNATSPSKQEQSQECRSDAQSESCLATEDPAMMS